MQHCSCLIYLSGDRENGVHKPDVTVAEIAVLRAIHGDDAVVNIKPTYMDKVKHSEELERLRLWYGPSNITKEGKRLIDEVYPGRAPTLPVNLADIDVEYTGEPAAEVKPEPADAAPVVPDAPTAPAPVKKGRGIRASDALIGGGDSE